MPASPMTDQRYEIVFVLKKKIFFNNRKLAFGAEVSCINGIENEIFFFQWLQIKGMFGQIAKGVAVNHGAALIGLLWELRKPLHP